jgi:outer membrane protein assembly factor BamB
MTRLIRSRRALLSCLAAITVGSLLAVAAATGLGSGVATPPRAHRALAAAQLSTGGQDSPQGSGKHRVVASSTFSNWPMFRGNAAHSGVSTETAISTTTASTLTAGWTATLGTSSYVSPAVATSSTLGEAVVYTGANGSLYAYPAKGGSAIWSFSAGTSGGDFQSSPAVFDGVVYDVSDVGTIYALNAATGKELCSYSLGVQVQASPVVVIDPNGTGPLLYVGTDPLSGAGAEYAIYGERSERGSCTVDWKYTNTAYDNWGTWSSPAYGIDANGHPILVFGSRDDDDSVYALNANTGALDWRYQTSTLQDLDVGAPPAISAPGKNGFASGVAYVTGKDKVVYALNLTTGALIWTYHLAAASNADVSGSALDGATLYLGSDDGVYALNAKTGALVWHVLTGPTFYASPAITGPAGQQVLVIGNNAGRLYALNLATGATLWTQRPTTAEFWASPAISQGTIYVIDTDGVLRTYTPAS